MLYGPHAGDYYKPEILAFFYWLLKSHQSKEEYIELQNHFFDNETFIEVIRHLEEVGCCTVQELRLDELSQSSFFQGLNRHHEIESKKLAIASVNESVIDAKQRTVKKANLKERCESTKAEFEKLYNNTNLEWKDTIQLKTSFQFLPDVTFWLVAKLMVTSVHRKKLKNYLENYINKFTKNEIYCIHNYQSYKKQKDLFFKEYYRLIEDGFGPKQFSITPNNIWRRVGSEKNGRFWELMFALQSEKSIKIKKYHIGGNYISFKMLQVPKDYKKKKINASRDNLKIEIENSFKDIQKKLDANTNWEDINIKFLDSRRIRLSANNVEVGEFDCEDLGFTTDSSGLPDAQWQLLVLLSYAKDGVPYAKNMNETAKWQKKKSRLSRQLKTIFGINSDPILVDKENKTYQCKMSIETWEEMREAFEDRFIFEE